MAGDVRLALTILEHALAVGNAAMINALGILLLHGCKTKWTRTPT